MLAFGIQVLFGVFDLSVDDPVLTESTKSEKGIVKNIPNPVKVGISIACAELAREWFIDSVTVHFDEYTEEAIIFAIEVVCISQIIAEWTAEQVVHGIRIVFGDPSYYASQHPDPERVIAGFHMLTDEDESELRWNLPDSQSHDGFRIYQCERTESIECIRKLEFSPLGDLPPTQENYLINLQPNEGKCYYIVFIYMSRPESKHASLGCYSRKAKPESVDFGSLGGEIVFASSRSSEGIQLYRMNADGSNIKQLSGLTSQLSNSTLQYPNYADYPSWSSDGSSIVFSGFDSGWQIYSIDRNGSQLTKLTDVPGCGLNELDCGLFDPQYSSNDERVIFRSNTFAIWSFLIETGEYEQLEALESGRNIIAVAVSPDGEKIAFVQFFPESDEPASDGDWWLCMMDIDGLNKQQLHMASTINNMTIDWSPGSQEIAFQYMNDIYVFNISTGEARNLTEGFTKSKQTYPEIVPWEAKDPAWSPDGKWIAFVEAGKTGSARAIWVVNSSGGDLQSITYLHHKNYDFGVSDVHPDWR